MSCFVKESCEALIVSQGHVKPADIIQLVHVTSRTSIFFSRSDSVVLNVHILKVSLVILKVSLVILNLFEQYYINNTQAYYLVFQSHHKYKLYICEPFKFMGANISIIK